MYAVDPMFLDVMECNTLPGDYLCVQSGYTRPFTTFLYPCLSVVIFSLLHAGIMKWRKRRSVKMIWLLVGCEKFAVVGFDGGDACEGWFCVVPAILARY